MQSKFTYAIKFVADMDMAIAFHRDVLGLKPKMTTPFWSEFDTGDVTLALHPASVTNPAGGVELGFSVPDLAGVYAAREKEGLTFTEAPRDEHGTQLSTILDCEGAKVSLSGA
ncbi:MAG TPA: VOC family protein [Caulobacteraceae bacterium]|nr:VOC family protein [Caulobacteraceae bacterium]